MKIITWNCNGAFRKKFQALDRFQADILVVQECENPALSDNVYNEWSGEYLWIGTNKNRGLGIFAKAGAQLESLNWSDDGLELFLPCRVNDCFNLLGVWTKNPESRKYRYIGQFWKYLQLHKEQFSTYSTVICGDLNSNAIWDKKHKGHSHSDVVRELDELNIKSIYHLFSGEEHGLETTPTQYMYRKIEKPYHLDYALMSHTLIDKKQSIYVGTAEDWLEHSDHMPIVFSLKL